MFMKSVLFYLANVLKRSAAVEGEYFVTKVPTSSHRVLSRLKSPGNYKMEIF